ncbi:MAG TPA: DEAD/DEAH box helicase [Firmicutes bacterium]|nr:DEAD/DEAH box helicase [Bacillota bacterium]
MDLAELIAKMQTTPGLGERFTCWKRIPPREARFGPWPKELDERLKAVLQARGIDALYTHQCAAYERVLAGRNLVVVTPTASGKTLCYNLPVLDGILKDDSLRALYIFPTKALAQDQVNELHELVTELEVPIRTFTYDGDTPADARRKIRVAGHIVVTNPDMLHVGILPHHTKWVKLFENLKYVVIDELHIYRGVFGSHFANVLRRLERICRFYGSKPQYICTSATIGNPDQLAASLIGQAVDLIDDNGAPAGEKYFAMYNPPVVNQELGIRKSSLLETADLVEELLRRQVQTIVFARSRLNTEILVTYIRERAMRNLYSPDLVQGYRGGYLPTERRAIERELREGKVGVVVSTNALELGIDIGQLEVCVLCGYPGSVASTWQRSGRAGRRTNTSATFLVASSSPLDQYIVHHPDYFFDSAPEQAFINPDNLVILAAHLKCAAFELPFLEDETFGPPVSLEILDLLARQGMLRRTGGRYYWSSDHFPANQVSLRSAATDNVVIIDVTKTGAPQVIGEIDYFSAFTTVHDEAIYIHGGRQYHVDKLDFKEKKAYVKQVDVDYYTDADLSVSVKVIDVFQEHASEGAKVFQGEVVVTAVATIFKKVRFHTHENLGWGQISLPEEQMHTAACWLSLGKEIQERFTKEQLQDALVGIAYQLAGLVPLYLSCDASDVRVFCEVRSPFTQEPTIYLYDRYPGGVGLSEKLYTIMDELLASALGAMQQCQCTSGCPSCVGPSCEDKEMAVKLLAEVVAGGSRR